MVRLAKSTGILSIAGSTLLVVGLIVLQPGCKVLPHEPHQGQCIEKGIACVKCIDHGRRTNQFARLDPITYGFEETNWRPHNWIVEVPRPLGDVQPASIPRGTDGADSRVEKESQPTLHRLPPPGAPEGNSTDGNEPEELEEKVVPRRPLIQGVDP